MPIADWNLQSTWDSAYSLLELDVAGQWTGNLVRYTRSCSRRPVERQQIMDLIAKYNIPLTTPILIVGCAFGWEIERLIEEGFTNVWGTDTSTWIQNNKGTECTVPDRILPHDVSTTPGQNSLKKSTGISAGQWGMVITMNLLPCFTDLEAQTFATNIRTLKSLTGYQVHIVQEQVTPDLGTSHSVEEWQLLVPLDTVYSIDLLRSVQ